MNAEAMDRDLSTLVWTPPAPTAPPALDAFWLGEDAMAAVMKTEQHSPRLFWDDPPWDYVDATTAQSIYHRVGSLPIAVSALGSHIGEVNRTVQDGDDAMFEHRIVPYRAERYGLAAEDIRDAGTIDLRIGFNGAFDRSRAYSENERRRLGLSDTDGDWPAAGLPVECRTMKDVALKVRQLRELGDVLSSGATDAMRIHVSLSAACLADHLKDVVAWNVDGLTIRADDEAWSGVPLAAMVRRLRTDLDQADRDEVALWLVPPATTPDEDLAKLVALGASAVAIDHWCDPLIWKSGVATEVETVINELAIKVTRFRSRIRSLRHHGDAIPLGCTDGDVAKRLGLPMVAMRFRDRTPRS